MFFDIITKNCFRKKQYNDIYQETVGKQVGMVYFDVLRSLASIDALGPSRSVLFNFFVIAEPLKHFHVCHGIPINKKLKKHELHVKKANVLLLDTSTNKQLVQKLKSKKFNDWVVLEFLLQSL